VSLAPGLRIGPFEVVSRLGAGGMGEVYRARDTRLGRDVALKTLPEALARDAERRARLEREACVLASLSHPNVASLFGIEDSDGAPVLVMELVAGPTLAERLLRWPLPVREALETARQVAEGVEAAHRRGIIHRDLKPGNVKLAPEGRVKVLDFGLAMALVVAGAEDPQQAVTTSSAGTGTGAVMGTTAYMSPEQARDEELDERTDVWSFGCLLYECLTGRRAFSGATASDTLAAVLEHAPDWAALPPSTPSVVRTLLRLCLQKDRTRRLQSITDVRLQIEYALADPLEETSVAAARPASRRRWLLLVAAGVVALAAILPTWLAKSTPSHGVVRLIAELPPETHLAGALALNLERTVGGNRPSRTAFALSPDGTQLVFTARKSSGRSQLYLRRLDQPLAAVIPGTEGADGPFFSPDGRWVGFWMPSSAARNNIEGALYKVAVKGGLPVKLCDTTIPYGVTWGAKGSIVFSREMGLWQVSAEGGTPRQVTKAEAGVVHRSPHFLPDGRGVLFTVGGQARAPVQIALHDLETGEQRLLGERGRDVRYLSGHLLYASAGTLMAVRFDAKRRRVTGVPFPVLDDVMQAANARNTLLETGALQLQVVPSGTLVYASGGPHPNAERAFLWLDRSGAAEPLDIPPGPYLAPRISKGSRIAFMRDEVPETVWTYDLSRRTLGRLTFAGDAMAPVWSPDGHKVAFRLSANPPGPGIFVTQVDGSGDLKPMATAFLAQPSSWSPDGRFLAAVRGSEETRADVWIVPTDGRSSAQPFLNASFNEAYPVFSSDGSWLAYGSDETGRWEVYVRPYPGPGPKSQISSDGGFAPVWAGSGRELFYLAYRDPSREPNVFDVVSVVVTTSPTFRASPPRVLFRARITAGTPIRDYDVTPDGRRFLVLTWNEPPDQRVSRLNVVLNWLEELKRLGPTP
jgi:serine/threonine-protein kinase